jgi:hypothetical protein
LPSQAGDFVNEDLTIVRLTMPASMVAAVVNDHIGKKFKVPQAKNIA